MARNNYQIIISVLGQYGPQFVHAQVEEVEGQKSLIDRWTEQREAKAAYFDYPTGRLLMHHVLGVIRS